MSKEFLGGVIEGFYGQPWTHGQRLTLIDQLESLGLNTYFYAPKDDLKHRAVWRRSYDDVEIGRMGELVAACQQQGLNFIYGLSPGLDIRFSDPEEMEILRQRLEQMLEIGVRHFALLFDDLPGKMTQQDRDRFSSVAEAQASVTNSIFEWLRDQHSEIRLLFCPTPYCDRMDRWDLGGDDYLDTIGDRLITEIDIFWTGPEIISEEIPKASIKRLTDRIGRKPVIWDNLHANDYDQRRLFCGPYSRSPELRDAVAGILLNPNNELPINYIPLRTLGDYLNNDDYEPRSAYLAAAKDWTERFSTCDDCVSLDDVVLLSDCHYLPFSDGTEATRLDSCVAILLDQPSSSWGDRLAEFEDFHRRINHLFEQLSQLRDRELFYAWSRRIWDLKEELDLISDFAKAKMDGSVGESGFASETHLESTCRGGFVANLQRRLRMNEQGSFETR